METRFKAPKCGYRICPDGSIVTDGTFKGKITGTQLGAILGESPWSTPFQAACAILGLTSEDISKKPAVRTGVALEGRIIDYVGACHPDIGLFIPAEDIFEKRLGDHDDWASDFEDEIFGGHVDGMVMTEEGENYILEVKTSSNMDSWVDGVPRHYWWQVALYNSFLTAQDKAYVVLGIVDSKAHKDPLSWVPGERTVGLFPMDIDQEEAERGIEKAREWYHEYIDEFRTPPMDPSNPRDVAMFEYLSRLTRPEEKIKDTIDRLADVEAELMVREDALAGLRATRDELKREVKDYMDVMDIDELDSTSGHWTAKVSSSVRVKVDTIKMAGDGIDPDKYSEKTIVKSFKLKIKKE